jgi:hypothetical protein
MSEWTVNNKLNEWYEKQYHIKLPKQYVTKALIYFSRSASPLALFAAGEAGVWYDPSDVANLAWRRNLLTYSEQFDNAAWSKAALLPVVANSSAAPDGTTTADTILPTTASDFHYIAAPATTVPANVQHIVSFYAKDAGYGFVRYYDGVANNAVYTLSGAGAVTGSTGGAATITSVGSGWYRCTKSVTPTTSTINCFLYPQNVVGSVAYAGNGTSGIFLWGAQLELGSVATDYQRITDVNTEVVERFPNATLYQDTIGTIPVTTPGQAVALMLDKSRGLTLGSEIVTNGSFSSGLTGWTTGGFGAASLQSGGAKIERTSDSSTNTALYWLTTMSTAVRYKVSFDVLSGSGILLFNDAIDVSATAGTKTLIVNAANASTAFSLRCYTGAFAVIDNISVRELPGNHATQATAASRPIYGVVPQGGRRNLFLFSEQFDNAIWQKQTNVTVTANAGADRDGVMVADQLNFASTTNDSIYQSIAFTAGQTCTFALDVKGTAGQTIQISVQHANGGNTFTAITFDGAWQRFSATATASTGGTANLVIDSAGATPATTCLVSRAQVELGTATPYQRVSSIYDVTEAGVPSCSYLFFDGGSDNMATGTITPGIDKAQVFAGVRKLSDATTYAMVAEFSANAGSNTGTFALMAPYTTSTYGLASKGTVFTDVGTAGVYPAPITNVLTGLGDISADRATLRINGIQAAQTTGDQGTGNYLAYPLYLGARGGTTLFFNGHLYSLITRFGATLDAPTIASTEAYVAGKTGFPNWANIVSPTIFARDDTAVLDRFNQIIERRA